VIRVTAKVNGPRATSQLNFCENLMSSFCVILLTNKQTKKQTHKQTIRQTHKCW